MPLLLPLCWAVLGELMGTPLGAGGTTARALGRQAEGQGMPGSTGEGPGGTDVSRSMRTARESRGLESQTSPLLHSVARWLGPCAGRTVYSATKWLMILSVVSLKELLGAKTLVESWASLPALAGGSLGGVASPLHSGLPAYYLRSHPPLFQPPAASPWSQR